MLMLTLDANDAIETNVFLSSATRESTLTFDVNRPLRRFQSVAK